MTDWSEEKTAELRRLADAGGTVSSIATDMGVTKGVVAGRTYRLGISLSGTPGRPGRQTGARVKGAGAVERARELSLAQRLPADDKIDTSDIPEADANWFKRARLKEPTLHTSNKFVAALVNAGPYECRFPTSDGICGKRVVPDKSWCKEHVKRCFVPAKR